MNSPVESSFSFIKIRKKLKKPIYLQLVDEFIKGIQLGYLKNDYQLPGSRQLASELKLNRNTIIKSLDELAMLGWIEIRPNKGTYIRKQISKKEHLSFDDCNFGEISDYQINSSHLYDYETKPDHLKIYLDDGKTDNRLVERNLLFKTHQSITKNNSHSDELISKYFIQQFINYLKISRNLKVDESQIHFFSNREIALQTITKIIQQPNKKFAVGQLNDFKTNLIFQSNNVELNLIPTDQNGLLLNDIKKVIEKTSSIYISSLHHYPTTAYFPQQNMNELLNIIRPHKISIIEENSNAQYYFTSRPINSIASTYPNSSLIHLSDFGQELTSSFNISFIIASSNFIKECKKLTPIYDKKIDPFVLKSISYFLNEGEMLRIEKKHRKIYRERREHIGNLLRKTFGEEITLFMPKVGLGLWIEWNIPLNLMKMKNDALEFGIYIPNYLLYQTKNKNAMRIGFGSLNEFEINEVVSVINKCVKKQESY